MSPHTQPLNSQQALQLQPRLAAVAAAAITVATGQQTDHPCPVFTAGPTLDAPRFLIGLDLNTFTLPLPIHTALASLRATLPPVPPPVTVTANPITPLLDLLLGQNDYPYLSLDSSKRSPTQALNQVGVNTFTRPLAELRGTVLVCNLERPLDPHVKAQLQSLRRLVRQF